MRSLQWLPYLLTEEVVGCQRDLLAILDGMQVLQNRTLHSVPLLVDMDIHYRVLKLLYGAGGAEYDFARNMLRTPLLFGVCNAITFRTFHYSFTRSRHCMYTNVEFIYTFFLFVARSSLNL